MLSLLNSPFAKMTQHFSTTFRYRFMSFLWKQIFSKIGLIVMLISVSTQMVLGQTTISLQDFESSPATPTLTFTNTNGTNSTGTNGASGNPANSNLFVSSSRGWQANNTTSTLTFANQSLLGYTNCFVDFRLAGMSTNATNGIDGADVVTVSISVDGGTTYSSELTINGNSANQRWDFTATGNTSITFDGNNTPTSVPSSSGVTGISTVTINIPNANSQVRVRISMFNNDGNERWVIDDVRIRGTISASVPTLSSPTSASIGTTSATLGATISSDGGASITSRGTVWGTSASPTTNLLAEGGTSVASYSHSRTGFTANTVYTYRGYAVNANGTGYSPDGTFTTLQNAPTIGNGSGATQTSIVTNWSAPSGGGAATFTYEVQVDDDNAFGSVNFSQSSISSGTTSVTANTGLSAGTTYYFRVRANNAGGSSAWSTTSIGYQTLAITAPIISSPTSTSISNTTATLGANVTSDGGASITARGVVWSVNTTNSNPTIGGTGVNQVAGTGTTGVYTVNVTGLPTGTVIAYIGYATNSQGTSYTTATTFTTLQNASKLAFGTLPPGSGTVSTNLTTFTVLAQRPDNSTDNTYTGTITINKFSGTGNLAGTVSATAVAGVATFSAVQFDAAATYVIFASATGLTSSGNSGNIAINTVSSNATDQFRSASSGDWSSTSTWQSFTGGVWVASTLVPTSSASTLSILNGHTVTVTSNVSADQLTVNSGGTLLVNNATLTINDDTGTDLTNNSTGTVSILGTGVIRMNGTISNLGTFGILTNGIYVHNNPVPDLATNFNWAQNSILSITGWDYDSNGGNSFFSSTANYGSIVWDSPTASATNKPNFLGNLRSINGNLWIKNTSTQDIRIFGGASGNITCTITGDLIISNGTLQISNGNPSNVGLLLLGNYSQTGGTFGTINSGGSNSAFLNLGSANGLILQSSGTIAPTSSTLNLNINSNAFYTLTSNFALTSPAVLTNNGTLNVQSFVISGSSSFAHASGATLITANPLGVTGSTAGLGSIQMTGTETYSAGASFIFNGTTLQSTGFRGTGTIAAPQMSANKGNIIINNINTVIQDGDITLVGTLSVPSFATYSTPATININKGTGGIVSVAGVFQTGDNNGFSAATGASLQGFTGASDILLGSGSIVQYNGGSQTVTNQIPYQNLLLSPSGTLTPAGNYTTLQNHSITGGTLAGGSNLITFGGDWYNSNQSNFSEATSTVNWNGSSIQSIICPGGENFYHLLVSGAGTLNQNNNVSVGTSGNGGLLITNGTLDAGTNTLNNAPNAPLNMTGGLLRLAKTATTLPEFTNNSAYGLTGGTIELYGSGNVTLRGGISYNNLLFTNLGIATITSAISSILGTVSITGTTTFDGISSNFGSSITNLFMNGSSLFRMQGTGTKPDMDGAYTLTGNSKIEFYNSGATQQTVRTQKIYNNVDITGSNVGQSSGNLTVTGGAFRVMPGATYFMTNQRIRGTGSFSVLDGATYWYGCYTGLPTDDNNGLTSVAGLGPIQVTGAKSFSTNAIYGFQGNSSCTPALQTGDLFPGTVAGLYMNKTGVPVLLTNDLVINGLLSVVGGNFDQSNRNVYLNGLFGGAGSGQAWTTNSASGLYITTVSSTVLSLPSFVNTIAGLLQIDRSVGIQLAGPLAVSANLMMTAGGIHLNGNQLTLNGNTFADLSTILGTGGVVSNGNFRTTNPNGFSGTGATIPNSSVTIQSGSIVEFAGSGTLTMFGSNISPAANNFHSVIASGGGTKYFPSGFNIGSLGYLNIVSGTDGDAMSNSYSFPSNSTVTIGGTFSTANAYGLSGNANSSFANITSPTITLLPGSTINYNGSTQSISSNLVYQNIAFNGSGSKILPNAPAVVNIQGDITNNLTTGGIGFGTSMVSLTGNNLQNINGAGTNTFYNLNINKFTNPVSISGISSMNQIIGILNIQAGPATTLYTNGKLALISLAFGTVSAQTSGAMLDWSTSSPTNGSVNGNVIVQRATLGNDPQNRAFYVSSPVSGNLDQLKSTSTNFFWYNETKTSGVVASGARSQLWESISSPSSTAITAGRGYSVRLKGLPNYSYGTVFAPTGPVFNGQIDYPTSFSTTLSTTTLQGWNLIGNPYPSAIDLNKIPYISGFSNVGNTFYIWQGDKFGTWTPTSGSSGNGTNGASNIVGAMQGFFVQASAAGNVRFNNTIRTTGQTDNLSFYRSSIDPNPMLGLTLSSGNYSDEVKIIFNPSVSASGDFDPAYDAYKLAPLAQVPYFYATKNGLPTALNNIPEINSNTIVPLSIIATSTANYKISSTGASSFDSSVDIFLQDKSNGILQDLKLNPEYQVNLATGTYTNRFFIVMRAAVVNGLQGLDAEKVKIYSYEGKVYIHSFYPTTIQASITLQEVSAKKVLENKSLAIYPGINQIDETTLADGVYVVSFSTEKLKQVAKVILIK